jgi:hypothetical protein
MSDFVARITMKLKNIAENPYSFFNEELSLLLLDQLTLYKKTEFYLQI